MLRDFLGIFCFLLAASGIINALSINGRDPLFLHKMAVQKKRFIDQWDDMPKYRSFSQKIDGSSLLRHWPVPYDTRIWKYEDKVRDILRNNNYPGSKIAENDMNLLKVSNILNTNDAQPIHTGKRLQNKGVIFSNRALLPIPSRQNQYISKNEETSTMDASTSYGSLISVVTDTHKADQNLKIDNEKVPLDDYRNYFMEGDLILSQNQTSSNDTNEVLNITITKDRSQTSNDKTPSTISTDIDLNKFMNNVLNISVDETSRESNFTTIYTSNEVSQVTVAENSSQRISFSQDISTHASADETNEYIHLVSVNENAQSTEITETTTLETKEVSTDAEIVASGLNSSTSNSENDQMLTNFKVIQSTIAQKATTAEIKRKSTEDSIDLDSSSPNTVSNSIKDQATINSKDKSNEDVQSTAVHKSTMFETITKSTEDSVLSVSTYTEPSISTSYTESISIKKPTKDSDSHNSEMKDLSDLDEPEHIIRISSIRAVKTVVSVVFLVVALVGTAVLTIYMIKVKRREVQYDQLTLLP